MAEPLRVIEGGGGPPQGRIRRPASPKRWARKRLAGITPDALAAIIQRAEDGDVEDWADLAAFIMRDSHVRAVYETRMLAIVGAEILVEPGRTENKQDEPMAEAAAEFFRRELESCDDLPGLLSALIHADGVGYAGAEHMWQRVAGEWHSNPKPIEPRDIRFDALWNPQVRTYKEGAGNGEWIQSVAEDRARWIFHVPQKLDRPTVAGDLVSVAWPWVFKRWLQLFRQEGLEKYGGPFIRGEVPENAPQAVMDELRDALESLSADQVGVFKQGSTVQFLETSKPGGEAWTAAIDHLNGEITKAILGSTLNTEVGSTGGNRALGESQADMTILPRLQTMAARLAATLKRDWAEPCLRFNAHRFGGTMPALPKISFQLTAAEEPIIDDIAVRSQVVTVDELRVSRGLDPVGPASGGDQFAEIKHGNPGQLGASRPTNDASVALGGVTDTRPLGRRPASAGHQRQSVVQRTARVPFAFSVSRTSSLDRGQP